jgi:hypothetical protein
MENVPPTKGQQARAAGEAQFKTLKYCPAFPGTLGSLHEAPAFCDTFFTYCNNEHRHSGIGLYSAAAVTLIRAPSAACTSGRSWGTSVRDR